MLNYPSSSRLRREGSRKIAVANTSNKNFHSSARSFFKLCHRLVAVSPAISVGSSYLIPGKSGITCEQKNFPKSLLPVVKHTLIEKRFGRGPGKTVQ